MYLLRNTVFCFSNSNLLIRCFIGATKNKKKNIYEHNTDITCFLKNIVVNINIVKINGIRHSVQYKIIF